MATIQQSNAETCSYCDTPVDDEQTYRRHLRDAHDPSELSAIDRRRYEQYRPEPNAVVRTGTEMADRLGDLRYPIDTAAMVRYTVYGFVSSIFVAALLGVGL